MPFILIKNNLKLMLRSKWILFMMIILPLITIILLSNAFKDMMDTKNVIEEFEIGYRISEGSVYKDIVPDLKLICKENNIILKEYSNIEGKELLQSKTVAVFVEITENSYVIYKSNDKKVEAAIAESIFSGFFYKVNESMTLMKYKLENGISESLTQSKVSAIYEEMDLEKVPSSTDYYGIIYIVYFAWCGMISLSAVISSERKSAIPKRMRISHISKVDYYLGKLIPCTLATFFETGTAWIISVLFLDIHWGKIGISIGIMFLVALAASAFGMVLFELFKNVAISIVVGFIIIWIAGMWGGSFQTYIYSAIPQKIADLSPLYYINRTLVEFSTKGYSDYFGRCLLYLIVIIFICGTVGILMTNRRMEDQ